MIIPGMSEEKILEELLYDRKLIAKKAQKSARKVLSYIHEQKKDHEDDEMQINLTIQTTKLHNNWNCCIMLNSSKKIKWCHEAVCMVESEHGTKDYYFVRGYRNDKNYYIKISSHAIKRFRERRIEDIYNVKLKELNDDNIPLLIQKGEIITWMKITDPKFLDIIMESEERHTVSTVFFTLLGCYLGYETPCGNFEFRTYLNTNKKLKGKEENSAMNLCRYAHSALNERFYKKDEIDILKGPKNPFTKLGYGYEAMKNYTFILLP